MSSEGKKEERLFSPKAVVATGHDQGSVSVEMNLRLETSHHFAWSMLILNLEDSSKVDNKNKLTAETGSEWAGNVFRHFPVFTSHILTLSSNWRQREKKKTLWYIFFPKTTQRQAFNAGCECFSEYLTSAFHFGLCQNLCTHRSWHDKIGLGVEVAAEDVVAVTFQSF